MTDKRTEAAAQALSDYWEPLRGHKDVYQETDLGQAQWALRAADKVMFSEENRKRIIAEMAVLTPELLYRDRHDDEEVLTIKLARIVRQVMEKLQEGTE
jgi:hypothetical protein